jgi:hypothetical protein
VVYEINLGLSCMPWGADLHCEGDKSTQFLVPRVFCDDLPSISVSRWRALGAVTAEMEKVAVKVGEELVEVGLALVRFPNGGSWSFFRCPCCDRKARTLRLFENQLMCSKCRNERKVRWSCEPTSPRKRALMRIPKLKAMLHSEVSLQLKPHQWGTMLRRKRLAAALARCEYIVAKADFKRVRDED